MHTFNLGRKFLAIGRYYTKFAAMVTKIKSRKFVAHSTFFIHSIFNNRNVESLYLYNGYG